MGILSLYHTLFTASTQQSTSVTLVHSFQPHNHYCFQSAPCYYSFLTTQRPGLDESNKELTTQSNHHHLHRRHHGLQHAARDTTLEARDDTYTLHVHNQCSDTKYFGLFEITSDFQMNSKCEPTEIAAGGDAQISANYKDIGLRLSATADQGAAAQWAPQSLAEFG